MTTTEKVGELTIRPQIRKGRQTGKVFVDIPAGATADGKRRRRLFDNRKTARAFARKLRDELAGENVDEPRSAQGRNGFTFAAAADAWKQDLDIKVAAREKRANSLRTDLDRLAPLRAFFDDLDVAKITEQTINRYRATRLAKGVTKRTINSEVALLRTVFVFNGVQPPAQPKNYPVRAPRHPVPTPDEVTRIVRHLSGRRALLVWLCAEAGLRPDEARHAIWSWFGHDGDGYPVVEVRAFADWEPKTAYAERVIPISEELLDAVLGLPRTSRFVFPSSTDPDQPMDNIRRALKTAQRRAGIARDGLPAPFSLKAFRKGFGTWLAAKRVDRATLQDLIGHARGSPVTEQFYIGTGEAGKRDTARTTHALLGPAIWQHLAKAPQSPVRSRLTLDVNRLILPKDRVVEPRGLEPLTSRVRFWRSPS